MELNSTNNTLINEEVKSSLLLSLSSADKQALIKELKYQNELALEAHKKKLEDEFQNKIDKLMASLNPPPRRLVRSPSTLDDINDEFNDASSYNIPPQIHIFEGSSKPSAKLSAIKDISTAKETTVVMSTKASSNLSINNDSINKNISKTNNRKINKEKKITGWHPPESYFVSAPVIDNQNDNQNKKNNIKQKVNNVIDRRVEYFQSKYGQGSAGGSVSSNRSEKSYKSIENSISDNTSIGTADLNDNSSLLSNITSDTFISPKRLKKKNFSESNNKNTSESDDIENKLDNFTRFMLRKSQYILDECLSSSRKGKKSDHSQKATTPFKKNEIESDNYNNNHNNNNISLPSLESHSSNNSINSNSVLSLFKNKKEKNSSASIKSNNSKSLSNNNSNDIDLNSYANNTVETNTTSLLDDWTAKNVRVMNIPEENYDNIHTDNQWKNEIAKHVLSVYATSKVPVNMRQSNLIMEDINLNNDGSNESSKSVSKLVFGDETDNSIGHDLNDNSTIETTSIISNNTMLKKSSSKKSIKPIEEFKSDMADRIINAVGHSIVSEDTNFYATENEEWLPSFTSNSKYRTCTMVHTAEGEVPVRGSPRVFPIWFVSSGDVYNDWSLLPNAEKLNAHLQQVYDHKLYRDYIDVVQNLILDELRKITGDGYDPGGLGIRRYSSKPTLGSIFNKTTKAVVEEKKPNDPNTAREDGAMNFWEELNYVPDPEISKTIPRDDINTLWKNLIFTCNAFAILSIENNNFELGMDLLNKAEGLAKREDVLPSKIRKAMKAYVYNGMAYYFYSKGSTVTCLKFTEKALKLHELSGNVEYAAVCLLHKSAALTQSCKFKDAHKILQQFMVFLEEGDLATLTCTPRQLCLVAIGYHNLAVVEMKLECPDFAAKNIQKARKVAQLCLSYSNRWLDIFRWTQEVTIEDVKFNLAVRDKYSPHLLKLINPLTDEMFNPTLL